MFLFDIFFQYFDLCFCCMVIDIVQVDCFYYGCCWVEGLVWLLVMQELIWSDIFNNCLMCWFEGVGVGVFCQFFYFNNGNMLDCEGCIVGCLYGGCVVVCIEYDGSIIMLVLYWQGKCFNLFNDVVVKFDGLIWFIDLDYGINSDYEGYQVESEIGVCNVYCIDGDSGDISFVSGDLECFNGLVFFIDESRFYIVDIGFMYCVGGLYYICVFDVVEGVMFKGGEVFVIIDLGLVDGFWLDVYGNIWILVGDGVYCYVLDGILLGKILILEVVFNVVFGGLCGNCFFIIVIILLYVVYLVVNGVVWF